MVHGLKPLLYGACLIWLSSQGVQAETWREHQFAGFSAFDGGALTSAVEHLETALAMAEQDAAPPQDLGAILESLATAYYAVGRQKDAWDTLGQWDRVLEKFPGEPWISDQRSFRSLLVHFMTEYPGETGGSAGLQNGGTHNAIPASGSSSGISGDYAIHLVSLGADSNVDSSWRKLNAAYPSQLTGRTLVVEPVDLGDQGTFKRVYAAPFPDLANAESACSELNALGQYCTALPLE